MYKTASTPCETIFRIISFNVKIAKALTIPSFAIHKIIKRFRVFGEISVSQGQGLQSILDAHDLRALRWHYIKNGHDSVKEIAAWAQELRKHGLGTQFALQTTNAG